MFVASPTEAYFVQVMGGIGIVSSLELSRLLADTYLAFQTAGADRVVLDSLSGAAMALEPGRPSQMPETVLRRLQDLCQGVAPLSVVPPLTDPRDKVPVDYPLPAAFRERLADLIVSELPPSSRTESSITDNLPSQWRRFSGITLRELTAHLSRFERDPLELQDEARQGAYLGERMNNSVPVVITIMPVIDEGRLTTDDVKDLRTAGSVIRDIFLLIAKEARRPDSPLFHQFWKHLAPQTKINLKDILRVLKAHGPL